MQSDLRLIPEGVLDAGHVSADVVGPVSPRKGHPAGAGHEDACGGVNLSSPLSKHVRLTLWDRWHHALKGKFLEGRGDSWMGHPSPLPRRWQGTATLSEAGRQLTELEGSNLKATKRFGVTTTSRNAIFSDIQACGEERFAVKSQTDATRSYLVEIPLYFCE